LRIRIAWISEAKGSGNLRAARRELNHASNIRQPSKLSRIESTTPEIPPHGSIRAHFVAVDIGDSYNSRQQKVNKSYLLVLIKNDFIFFESFYQQVGRQFL
jgi:hypothetical protein